MKSIKTGMIGVALVVGAHVNAQTEQVPAQKEETESKKEVSGGEGAVSAPVATQNSANTKLDMKHLRLVRAEQKKTISEEAVKEEK